MSWINALAETYDNCSSKAGVIDKHGNVLLPISHSTAQAQLEIVIDQEGNFIRAEKVEKANAMTIIPVTEDSASRGNGINPMPLCDKLCYIAGDYDTCVKPDKSMVDYHAEYMKELKKWADKEETPHKVKAIFKYLSKSSVISDLMRENVYENPDAFVRFIVESNTPEPEETRVWLDKEIYKNYEMYYSGTLDKQSLCYVTGQRVPITEKLPSKVRNTGDKAKIISSNDTSGYTFRGRFVDASEAVGIGYLTAQKTFNALRWLIAKQGYRNESESIVCWSVGGENLPGLLDESEVLFPSDDEEQYVDTAEEYAKRVNKAIAGYSADITPITRIIVMALDTADGSGQGRLAITYYNEMSGSEFLTNLEKWHSECIWRHTYHKNTEGKYYSYIGAPSPREIVLSAYGTDQEGLLKADAKVIKKAVDRILPCVAQSRKIPKDIVQAAVKNAGSPQRYSGYNWNRILTNTCALIRKQQLDYGREVYEMALNVNSVDRDYLFGRLLAVGERIESQCYYRENIERQTNAKKYWSTYTRKPSRTWSVIYDRLLPYFNKLKSGEKEYYTRLIGDILGKLEENEGFNNDPLKENYLLGYYSQTMEFRKKKENEVVNGEEEDTDNE